MEESNIKEINNEKPVYRLNREQRRKAEREQRRLNKKLKKKKIVSDEDKGKLINIVKAAKGKVDKINLWNIFEVVKEKAVKVKEETGIDKMYFCINADNVMDTLIIKYEGSEDLKKSLGVLTDITLDNGKVRTNNIVIYAEVSPDNVVNIEDSKRAYHYID